MKVNAVIAVIVGMAVALTGYGCGREAPSGTAQRSTTSTTEAPCSAPRLNPSFLSPGLETVDEPRILENGEWWNTWRNGNTSWIQILGGISADRGDDPSARSTTIRGHEGQIGPLPLKGSTYVVIDWGEHRGDCFHQYAVISRGTSDQELLKIANSLEELD